MVHWKNDTAISVILIILSGFVFFKSSDFPVEAAYFPKLFACALAVVSLILLIVALHRKQTAEGKGLAGYKHAFLIVLGLVAYTLLLRVLGYIAATGALVFYVILMLGYKKYTIMLLTTVLSVAFAYIVFGILLGVPLPHFFE